MNRQTHSVDRRPKSIQLFTHWIIYCMCTAVSLLINSYMSAILSQVYLFRPSFFSFDFVIF